MSDAPQRKVLLVDSSAVLHRSFHGYPTDKYQSTMFDEPITVNALHGYLKYILRLQQDFECDDLIHVLDPDGGSVYRKTLYPDYKANRPPTDPLLKQQKDIFAEVLSAFAQRWIQVPGVESDDVLATLAKRHADRGDLVLVVTPDKDLLQLVEDGRIAVATYVDAKPMPGDTYKRKEHKYFDEAAVIAKLGVRPSQVADFLAIMGDEADNLMGVDKAGPKTAAKWLNTYGDLETLLTHADEINGVVGNNLRSIREMLPTMKLLTTTLYDVDVPELSTIQATFDVDFNAEARTIVKADPSWPHDLQLEFDEPTSTVSVRTSHTVTQTVTASSQGVAAVRTETTERQVLQATAAEPPIPARRSGPYVRPSQA